MTVAPSICLCDWRLIARVITAPTRLNSHHSPADHCQLYVDSISLGSTRFDSRCSSNLQPSQQRRESPLIPIVRRDILCGSCTKLATLIRTVMDSVDLTSVDAIVCVSGFTIYRRQNTATHFLVNISIADSLSMSNLVLFDSGRV